MPDLHLAWPTSGALSGRLLIWAEGESAAKHSSEEHPRAVDPATLDAQLATAERTPLSLWLPTTSRGPKASRPDRTPPRGRPAKPRFARWKVPSRALAPTEAIAWLLAQRADPSDELRSFHAAARLLLEALANQRFVPALIGAEARWRLHLADDAIATQLAALASALPAVCRAACSTPEQAPSARALLEDFLHTSADAFIRDHAPPLRQLEGRTSPGRRWIAALTGKQAVVAGSPAQLDRLGRAHAHWFRALTAAGDTETRITLRLEEPPEGEELWRLRTLLQSRTDPSLQVDAREAWSGALGPLQPRFPNAQALLLSGLGHAGRIFPPLLEGLKGGQPRALELTAESAFTFLRDAAPLLQDAGFGVLIPPWWTQVTTRLGARLTVSSSTSASGGRGEGHVSAEALMQFEWQLAIGEATLSAEEFTELTRHKLPLVRWRGAWVRLDPEAVEAAARFFEARGETRDLPFASALAGAFGVGSEVAGLPVVAADFSGDAERWLSALKTGAPDEPWEAPSGLVAELRPYQKRGAAWLTLAARLGMGVCLADDMGLGKTLQTLAFILAERDAGHGPALVVCPTSVVRNWRDEAIRFAPTLRLHVHHGSDRLRDEALGEALAQADLVITSYPLLRSEVAVLNAQSWHAVVLDEAQQIKNPDTAQARAARTLQAQVRIALTGTPIENRLDELWSLSEFLNPGYLGERRRFQRELALPIEREGDPERTATLRRLVQPLVLRRLKSDRSIIRDLPDKVIQAAWVNLSTEQASLYQGIIESSLEAVEAAAGIERRGLVLKLLTRLKQVCNHPAQALGERPEPLARGEAAIAANEARSPKLARLSMLIEELIAAGDAALIFTQYRQMGDLLAAHLQARFGSPVPFLHGGVASEKRAEMVSDFQRAGGPPLFLLSLKAGGTGLNLTRASHVFHFDRWWNPAVEDQATDRAYRIGQRKGVNVHTFITTGTLEERIAEMIESKRALAGEVLAHGEAALANLDTESLRELVALRAEALA